MSVSEYYRVSRRSGEWKLCGADQVHDAVEMGKHLGGLGGCGTLRHTMGVGIPYYTRPPELYRNTSVGFILLFVVFGLGVGLSQVFFGLALAAVGLSIGFAGTILRLQEIAGNAATTALKFPRTRVKSATLCNGLEDDVQPLKVEDNSVNLAFQPNEVLTVRVQ